MLAMPMVPFEQYFAMDSTGFGGYSTIWLNSRLKPTDWKCFNKLHIVTGTLTGVIATAKITTAHEHDTSEFPNMLKDSCRYFSVKEISADKGYLSRDNATAAEDLGVTPYICPKKTTQFASKAQYWIRSEAWNRMVGLWKDNEKLFMEHYHRRSNVESTFSAMKRKFLPYIRSKHGTAQMNEILAKVCCHNASVLINGIFELGAKSDFRLQEGFYAGE
jgi:transposase